jgi:hypothetical protein
VISLRLLEPCGLAIMVLIVVTGTAMGQAVSTPAEDPSATITAAPDRPAILSQRYAEDWFVLRDPSRRTEPLDALKYIPLGGDDLYYLSFGFNVRERVESLNAPLFGTSGQKGNTYLLSRTEVHADLRLNGWQAFVQLEDAEAPWKTPVSPVDADRLDVEQAFIAHVGELGDGVLKLRAGRQEFNFDQQRFVSARDGANVRQAFDALWADYEIGDWRAISFVSHPTQYQNNAVFDDYSGYNLVLDGVRIERRALGPGNLAVYYLRYQRDDARFIAASGNERRNAFDLHYDGVAGPVDFDIETMAQQGDIGNRPVLAWAIGGRGGYTWANTMWTPHLWLQFDAASGNTSHTGSIGTFNPLFPNESYFSLAGLTGYANLIHLKPTISVAPDKTLTLQAAIGLQWRETTQDAIYVVPVQPIANTAGRGSLWSAAYFQLDAVKRINAHVAVSAEFVHYQIGASIRAAGGHNADYAEVQVSFAW